MHQEGKRLIFFKNWLIGFVFLSLSLIMQDALVPITNWAEATVDCYDIILSYMMSWGSHSLISDWRNYYNPPVFFPDSNMGFSIDGMELPAVLMLPVWVLFKNPFLMANLMMVLAHFFTLTTSYYVLRKLLPLNRILAVLGAIIFSVSSDQMWHSEGHFNLVWSGLIPLAFLSTWNSLETGRLKFYILNAVVFGLCVYLSIYYFVILGLCYPVIILSWFITRQQIRLIPALNIVLSLILGALISLPKILLYKSASAQASGLRMWLAEADKYSANWRGYLLPTQEYSGIYDLMQIPKEPFALAENNQFIGYTVLAIILAEVLRLVWKLVTRSSFEWYDRLSLCCMAGCLFFVMLSFGPAYTILGISPYTFLYESGLKYSSFFRVPGRLAFSAEWFLTIPCAVFLSRSFLNQHPLVSFCALALFLPVHLFEHIRLSVPPQFPSDHGELARLFEQAGSASEEPFVDVYPKMEIHGAYTMIPHWKPTVNGWQFAALNENFNTKAYSFLDFPSTSTIGWMANHDVPWVSVPIKERKASTLEWDSLEFIGETSSRALFRLVNPGKAKKDYRQYLENRKLELSKLREKTSDTLQWPRDTFLAPCEFPYEVFQPIERPINSLSMFTLTATQPIVPGAYDVIEVQYRMRADIPHQTRLFWRPRNAAMNGKRMVVGDIRLVDPASHKYVSIFPVGTDHEWLTDDDLAQLHFESHRFESLLPEEFAIVSIEFKRHDSITIPEI